MKSPLILTLDFGTQSVLASLITKSGELVGLQKIAYDCPYFSTKKGYAEQNADYYWGYAVNALKMLSASNEQDLKNIIGATITAFRDTSVQLDKDRKHYNNKRECLYFFIPDIIFMQNIIIILLKIKK